MMKCFAELEESGVGEEGLRVDTEKGTCWSKDDEKMIRAIVEGSGGFATLNDGIYDFRRSSYSEAKKMFKEFNDWFTEFSDLTEAPLEEGSINWLSTAIRKAAVFVALHCLVPLAEDADDEATVSAIRETSGAVLEHFQGPGFLLPHGCPPPPRITADDLFSLDFSDPLQEVSKPWRENKSFLNTMIAMCEMGAGGRDSVQKVKDQFSAWDEDGDGEIKREEFAKVLRKLDPDMPDDDIDALFDGADQNRNGVLCVDEFLDFICRK